jgi:capsular exopolysaccharide synthesis family protein
VIPDLRHVPALGRWILFVLVGAVIGGAAAFGASTMTTPEYRATAQLYLAPASSATASIQDVAGGQRLATGYVQLANANVVLSQAMERIGWKDLKSFRERTQISQVRDTPIILISFVDADPALAAEAANAIAEVFIVQSRTLQSSLQETTVAELDEQIRRLQEDIRTLDAQIAALRPNQDVERTQLDSSRQSKQQTLASIAKTRDDIRIAALRAENTVSLWEPAAAPLEPETPRVGLNTVLGAIAGALIVVLLVAVWSRIDDRVHTLEALREKLGIAPLGEVHRGTKPETFLGKLFLRESPTSPEAEAFRALRTNILFANVDRQPRTILVTSALPLEGKSVVSSNLALAFAQAGTRTVLIDADLRRPSQHSLFRVRAARGLTTLLVDPDPLAALEEFRVTADLYVVPSGPLPPNPAELLSSARMSALLQRLVDGAGAVVIIDTSPVLAVADPAALATKVDGCVLVVDAARTHTNTARQAAEALRRVHAPMLGGVLNKVVATPGRYYGYYATDDDPRQARPNWISRRGSANRWRVASSGGNVLGVFRSVRAKLSREPEGSASAERADRALAAVFETPRGADALAVGEPPGRVADLDR